MDPITALERAVETGLLPAGSSILLAVSGGADSMALLEGAAQVAREAGWRLSVGHVHHGWRGREADRDLAFVGEHARRRGLPFFARWRDARGEASRRKLSPEAAARFVRYAALAEIAREADAPIIATAHHRDDRIESHLLALERHGGLAALAGPLTRRLDGVVRPLLSVSRAQILQFLRTRGVAHRRDSSNGDLRLARTRIRRELASLQMARGEEALEAIARRVERLDFERERVDGEFEKSVRPRLSRAPDRVAADAAFLQTLPAALLRRALEEASRPFAAPGRPPLTGPEREQVLSKVSAGRDFRFEAGRRIRFERRGPLLTVGPVRR